MKLGNDTLGVRRRVPRVDGSGNPMRSPLGAQLVDVVDRKIRWCSVYPTRRRLDDDEPKDRAAPMISGLTALVPPRQDGVDTDLGAVDVVIWPVTSEQTVNGLLKLTGPVHEVVGEPGPWGTALEVQLRKST